MEEEKELSLTNEDIEELEDITEEEREGFKELKEGIEEFEKIEEESYLDLKKKLGIEKDPRTSFERIEVQSKVLRLTSQLEVVRRIKSDKEFTYEKFLEEKDNEPIKYSGVEYYVGETIDKDNIGNETYLASNFFKEEKLKDAIKATNDSLDVSFIKNSIKKYPYPINKEKVTQATNRTIKKITKQLLYEEDKLYAKISLLDFDETLKVLNKVYPDKTSKIYKFIFNLSKYTDKHSEDEFIKISEFMSNLRNLQYGDLVKQNEKFHKDVEELLDSL